MILRLTAVITALAVGLGVGLYAYRLTMSDGWKRHEAAFFSTVAGMVAVALLVLVTVFVLGIVGWVMYG